MVSSHEWAAVTRSSDEVACRGRVEMVAADWLTSERGSVGLLHASCASPHSRNAGSPHNVIVAVLRIAHRVARPRTAERRSSYADEVDSVLAEDSTVFLAVNHLTTGPFKFAPRKIVLGELLEVYGAFDGDFRRPTIAVSSWRPLQTWEFAVCLLPSLDGGCFVDDISGHASSTSRGLHCCGASALDGLLRRADDKCSGRNWNSRGLAAAMPHLACRFQFIVDSLCPGISGQRHAKELLVLVAMLVRLPRHRFLTQCAHSLPANDPAAGDASAIGHDDYVNSATEKCFRLPVKLLLVGSKGCGKSTLLRAFERMLPPNLATSIGGQTVADTAAVRAAVLPHSHARCERPLQPLRSQASHHQHQLLRPGGRAVGRRCRQGIAAATFSELLPTTSYLSRPEAGSCSISMLSNAPHTPTPPECLVHCGAFLGSEILVVDDLHNLAVATSGTTPVVARRVMQLLDPIPMMCVPPSPVTMPSSSSSSPSSVLFATPLAGSAWHKPVHIIATADVASCDEDAQWRDLMTLCVPLDDLTSTDELSHMSRSSLREASWLAMATSSAQSMNAIHGASSFSRGASSVAETQNSVHTDPKQWTRSNGTNGTVPLTADNNDVAALIQQQFVQHCAAVYSAPISSWDSLPRYALSALMSFTDTSRREAGAGIPNDSLRLSRLLDAVCQLAIARQCFDGPQLSLVPDCVDDVLRMLQSCRAYENGDEGSATGRHDSAKRKRAADGGLFGSRGGRHAAGDGRPPRTSKRQAARIFLQRLRQMGEQRAAAAAANGSGAGCSKEVPTTACQSCFSAAFGEESDALFHEVMEQLSYDGLILLGSSGIRVL